MNYKYSLYCIHNCPIGKKQSEKLLAENNSAADAAFDMQEFADKCKHICKYENERREYDKGSNDYE